MTYMIASLLMLMSVYWLGFLLTYVKVYGWKRLWE